MNKIGLLILTIILVSCNEKKIATHNFSRVVVTPVYSDTCNIRALEVMNNGTVAFAGKDGFFGSYDPEKNVVRSNIKKYDSIYPEFRAAAHTSEDFFMLSVGNPALLYKTAGQGEMKPVYTEHHEKVFYDAMKFWNDKEGIAVGDATDDCASMIITRDGGKTWSKVACEKLPKIKDGEAFFAASNTNIAMVGNKTWIASGGSRSAILYSDDKGESWKLYETPFVSGSNSEGIFSIDFYDSLNGFAVGGNYTNPDEDTNNKAITNDGGKTWKIVANDKGVGYKSCVQYVPNGNANEIVAIGKNGIVYTQNAGNSWKKLSDEGFYTFRFINDSTAIAAGKNSIARLEFKS
ncbi:BNR/Asp-box repeat-containing protein [Pustulibacterium marinum]|uniref:BNR/Asp-box repeat-containing protein n=1 Tax=Pustulibacterium marinum TaxID=1224947 RepID=A0A1I7H540_9FLAO|nr:sialidase family protein [Pustulibacterium marinum]SFU55807.1 BNR/Asp-box repeat-containing protein [Pustulibacterium marinum]